MKIAMICGKPGIACGIADYTGHLVSNLQAASVQVHPLTLETWDLLKSPTLLRQALNIKVDAIHIQYPAAVYGKGLAPQGLAFLSSVLKIPLVVTVHEFSQTHLLRRLAMVPFSFANALVFTNHFELENFCHRFSWSQPKSCLAPVGSSVPYLKSMGNNNLEVVYFGLIRPNKGIEAFLDLAAMCQSANQPFKFLLIGSPQIGERSYFDQIQNRLDTLSNVRLESELNPEQVAQRLSCAQFAYFPFPDGASERRTSLLAAMGNGLLVLTTSGKHTPPDLAAAVKFVSDPGDALRQLQVLSESAQAREALQLESLQFVKRFSWESITEKHVQIYTSLISRKQFRS
jgi:glycosyltransferase involved in cell wall biosynthesis